MTLTRILTQLRTERTRIDQAIAAIESLDHSPSRRRGRPAVATSAPKRRRRMSAAAKRKIAAAQKRRWAAWRKRKKAA